jgi:hypothetical protein
VKKIALRAAAVVARREGKKVEEVTGIPQITRYTLRHFMNTRAMRVPVDIKPDREERAIWMGHADPRYKTTQGYEHMDPDYLIRCMQSTDAIMNTLDLHARKSLAAPGTTKQGFHVVEKRA